MSLPKYETHNQTTTQNINLHRTLKKVPDSFTKTNQAHFYSIAYGSLMEVLAQLDVACDLGYITKEEFKNFEIIIDVWLL